MAETGLDADQQSSLKIPQPWTPVFSTSMHGTLAGGRRRRRRCRQPRSDPASGGCLRTACEGTAPRSAAGSTRSAATSCCSRAAAPSACPRSGSPSFSVLNILRIIAVPPNCSWCCKSANKHTFTSHTIAYNRDPSCERSGCRSWWSAAACRRAGRCGGRRAPTAASSPGRWPSRPTPTAGRHAFRAGNPMWLATGSGARSHVDRRRHQSATNVLNEYGFWHLSERLQPVSLQIVLIACGVKGSRGFLGQISWSEGASAEDLLVPVGVTRPT